MPSFLRIVYGYNSYIRKNGDYLTFLVNLRLMTIARLNSITIASMAEENSGTTVAGYMFKSTFALVSPLIK